MKIEITKTDNGYAFKSNKTETKDLARVNPFETIKEYISNDMKRHSAELGKDQEDQIINHMKETHRLKQDSELELNLAGIETAIKFSWENTAREILNGI